jgi:uncharacterized protein (TIGR03435 family)
MRRATVTPGVLISLGSFAFGQVPLQSGQSKLTFEVASVRPAAPLSGVEALIFQQRGGPESADPGQISYTNIPLQRLVMMAYGISEPYEISAPGWLDDERYDVVAKLDPSSTRDQLKVMLQNLLAERFGMTIHHETKNLSIYELVIAKGGSKVKEVIETLSPSSAPADTAGRGATDVDANGLRQRAPGQIGLSMIRLGGPSTRFSARQQPISALTQVLQNPLGRTVVDGTGLRGKYDFNLDWTRDARTSANVRNTGGAAVPAPVLGTADSQIDVGPPDLFTALQQQLGLKLEEKKGPVDVVVVDHAEKMPTKN